MLSVFGTTKPTSLPSVPTTWDFGSIKPETLHPEARSSRYPSWCRNDYAGTFRSSNRRSDASEFTLNSILETVILGAGQSVVISAGFAPQSAGIKTAFLQIDDKFWASPETWASPISAQVPEFQNPGTASVPLSGTGVAPLVLEIPWQRISAEWS